MVVLLAVIVATAAVVVTGATGTVLAQGGAPEGPTPTAGFNQSTITQERGDVATIGVDLTDTRTANVTVGSRWKNYEAHVTVVDDDGDGRVRLRMNTYLAGRENTEPAAAYEAAGNDSLGSVNRTIGNLTEPLDPSQYNLSVAVGTTTTTDTATLDLGARSTDGLVTWTAPAAAFGNVTDTSEVATAVNRGVITTAETVAAGDVLVAQVEASGVHGALAAANLSTLVERGVLDFGVRQTNPETNRQPKTLNVTASLDNDSIQVIDDPDNDTLYVNVDTGAATVEHGSIAPGDAYEITFGVNESSGLATGAESLSANVSISSPTLGLGSVALAAATNQTVAGTTSIAPGSRVRVTIAATTNGSIARTATATVGSNGTFAAEFNLSGVPANTSVVVNATGPLDTTDEVEVAVGRPSTPTTTTALTFGNQTSTGTSVVVANASLQRGGFVVVRPVGGQNDSARRPSGRSDYLEPGTHADIEIPLATPLDANATFVATAHTDSNDNRTYDFPANQSRDRPYTVGGQNVTATASVAVTNVVPAAGTGTPTGADTPTGTGTPSAAESPGLTATRTTAGRTPTDAATQATSARTDSGIDIDTLSAVIGGFVGVLAVVLVVALVVLGRR